MEDVKKATPMLNASLDVDCPYCGHYFNLFENDDDHIYGYAIFNNDWANVYGCEETCPKCKKEFTIEKIEY